MRRCVSLMQIPPQWTLRCEDRVKADATSRRSRGLVRAYARYPQWSGRRRRPRGSLLGSRHTRRFGFAVASRISRGPTERRKEFISNVTAVLRRSRRVPRSRGRPRRARHHRALRHPAARHRRRPRRARRAREVADRIGQDHRLRRPHRGPHRGRRPPSGGPHPRPHPRAGQPDRRRPAPAGARPRAEHRRGLRRRGDRQAGPRGRAAPTSSSPPPAAWRTSSSAAT